MRLVWTLSSELIIDHKRTFAFGDVEDPVISSRHRDERVRG